MTKIDNQLVTELAAKSLEQLHALVPRALQELLVLLLAHLLAALLDQRPQTSSPFVHSVPKRFRRSIRFTRKLASRRTEPSLSAFGGAATGEIRRSPPSSPTNSR